ncbi:UNVERIFIED_CONTAM: hypothetical protein FKN15_026291 [Acipenser sinensis]
MSHFTRTPSSSPDREYNSHSTSSSSSSSDTEHEAGREPGPGPLVLPLPCMGKTRGPLEVLLDTALEDMGIPLDAKCGISSSPDYRVLKESWTLGDSFWSGSNIARADGVGILFKNPFITSHSSREVEPGRILSVDVTYNNTPLRLVNVYAPTNQTKELNFFHSCVHYSWGTYPSSCQGCLVLRIAWGCLVRGIAWGSLLLRIAWGCLLLRIAWDCLVLRIAWGCLVLHIAAGCTVAGTPPRGAAGHEKGRGGLETTNPSSSFTAGDHGGGQETCSHCSTFVAGRTVAGAPPRGVAGFEEGGGGPETTNPSSSFAAKDRGGGQETCSHCSTCAAGSTVAGASQKGAASYEEGGRSGDHPSSSLSAAMTATAEGVSLGSVSTSADSMASSSLATGNIAAHEHLKVPVLGPGL